MAIITGTDGQDNLSGTDGYDTVYGGANRDFLRGQGDPDVLYGGSGDDTLDDRSGSDTLYGDSGDDRLDANGSGDVTFLFGGEGDDASSFDLAQARPVFLGITRSSQPECRNCDPACCFPVHYIPPRYKCSDRRRCASKYGGGIDLSSRMVQ